MTTEQTLPKGWKIERLGDIAISTKGKKPKNQSNEKTDTYCYPYVDIEAFEKGVIKSYTDGEKCVLCDEDDFLMVWDGSRSGLVGKGVKGALGSTLVRISLPEINNLYAYYFLLSKYQEINTRAKGSGTPHVDPDLLWNYAFPIPPNKETQQAIVNKIESLFAEIDVGISSLKTAVQQLAQYRQSLLKNAFNGELTKAWREENADTLPSRDELLAQIQTTREQHHAKQLANWQSAVSQWEENGKEGKKPSKPKPLTQAVKFEEDLADLPNGWLNFLLEELAEISGGLTKNSKRNTFEEKVPYLRVANVYANELKLDEIETIGIQESEKERTLLQLNDLLIVEGNGSIEQIGRVALWNDAIKPCYHQNHLIKARCYPFMLPKFVLYFLMSPMGRKRIIDVASSTTGLHTLSLTKIANLVIPVCSLTEQTQIVAILENKLTACDRLATDLAAQLKQAELLKQSVLKAAFSGKLGA